MFSIGPGEATNMFFRIVPSNSQKEGTNTHNLLKGHAQPPNSPHNDFLSREKAFLKEKRKVDYLYSHAQITNGLDLVLFWGCAQKGEDEIFFGQHNICNISVNTPTAPEKSVSQDALRFRINSPRNVEHDFRESR